MNHVAYMFWRLSSRIIEMLHEKVSCDYLHWVEILTMNVRVSRGNSLTLSPTFSLSV